MADREREAEVARRLEEALHQEVGRGHVDVAELLRGTRRRTRRERMRRTAVLAAAAVVVAAVPVGIAVAQRDGVTSGPPATLGPSSASAAATTPPATPTPEPTGQTVPTGPAGSTEGTAPAVTGSPAATERPEQPPVPVPSPALRYGIPVGVMPTVEQLGRGSEILDASDYPNGPTLMGQACGVIPEARRPGERRTLATSNDAQGTFQVNVVVTAWRDSRAAFRSLVEDAGACRLSPGMEWSARRSPHPDSWAAVGTSNGLQYGFAARRLEGDVIVTVTVVDADQDTALKEALRVLDLTVQRAVDAGIARESGE